MPLNNGSPTIGRFFKAGFGFLSSPCGLPVDGSIGSRSETTTPQIPPPHLLTRTLASPAWVSQMPLGSRPCAFAGGTAINVVKIAMIKENLQAIDGSPGKGDCISINQICAKPYWPRGHLPQREK